MDNTYRTSEEIVSIFTAKGCEVKVKYLGDSYRAGGEIFIYAPGLDPTSKEGFAFNLADFYGFDGTGYDGRGRKYNVWVVTKGEYVPATVAEFFNASEDRRIKFGAEHRSCSNVQIFVHRDEISTNGFNDLATAFDSLGL